jgi:uncharacterized delta-60 repeat protein
MIHIARVGSRYSCLAVAESLERRRLFATGDLDPSFGDGGITDDIRANHTMAYDGLLLPGDKILVGGEAQPDDGGTWEYLLRRYNADGSLDTTFGQAGEVRGKFAPDLYAAIYRMTAAPGGQVVAVVAEQGDDFDRYGLVRFNADGSLDTTFGDGGFIEGGIGVLLRSSLAVQDDGKVVVGGEQHVYRYNADGTPDSTFADGGHLALPFNRTVSAVIALPGNAGVMVAGTDNGDSTDPVTHLGPFLMKLADNGTPDMTFGVGGEFTPADVDDEDVRARDVLRLPDGRFILSAHVIDGGTQLRRVNANGTLDTTFGDNGLARDPFDPGGKLVRDDDGRIYVTGFRGSGSAIRFSADGDFDESFGRVFGFGDPGGSLEGPAAFVQNSADRLVIVGGHQGPNDFGVTLVGRLTEDDGEPSPITLSGGVVSVSGTDGHDYVDASDFSSANTVLFTSLNGVGRAFAIDDVDLLSVSTGDGDDIVDLTNIHLVPTLVNGGDGSDSIAGSAGRDTLNGNAGNDRIDGGSGADLLNGNGGNDRLRGQGGHDRVRGGAGRDGVVGNTGNDRLEGGSGIDVMFGNEGDDFFGNAADGAADSLFGDAGSDRMDGVGDEDDLLTAIEQQV